MYESFAVAWVTALKAYALLGAVFGLAFTTAGIGRIDPNARGAGLAFRVLILPGAMALWPLLLSRWLRGIHEPPLEGNPQR